MATVTKTRIELAQMREAGAVVAAVLAMLRDAVQPGVRTEELDKLAEAEARRLGAIPSFKGYHGFPASICASVNDEVVHGIPGERALREGDIISLDFGAIYHHWHGDAAITVGVGRISPEAQRLLHVTEEALYQGIAQARAGRRLQSISRAIQEYVERAGFSVVRQYVGHGIGREMREQPQIPNYVDPRQPDPLLRPGMVIAIEPMVNVGGYETRVRDDGWSVVTADGSLSAHFEHTVAITDGEPEILTVRT